MAIRLLGRQDCSAFPPSADMPLDLGSRIAIIDLRVFVPEVVSVLSTFSKDSFSTSLAEIPFANKLIGRGAVNNIPNPDLRLTPRDLITSAIHNSEIQFLRILPRNSIVDIINRICSLKQVTTLYGTQLEAFYYGLVCDAHCTQVSFNLFH